MSLASQESHSIIELKGSITENHYIDKTIIIPDFTGAELTKVTLVKCDIKMKNAFLSMIGCSCILKSCVLEDSTLRLENTTLNCYPTSEPVRALGKSVVLSYGETIVVPGVTVKHAPDKNHIVSKPIDVCELVQCVTSYIKPYVASKNSYMEPVISELKKAVQISTLNSHVKGSPQ